MIVAARRAGKRVGSGAYLEAERSNVWGLEMPKGREIPVFVAKKRDEKIIKALAKHLNQGAAGQRAARTKRKKGGKK